MILFFIPDVIFNWGFTDKFTIAITQTLTHEHSEHESRNQN